MSRMLPSRVGDVTICCKESERTNCNKDSAWRERGKVGLIEEGQQISLQLKSPVIITGFGLEQIKSFTKERQWEKSRCVQEGLRYTKITITRSEDESVRATATHWHRGENEREKRRVDGIERRTSSATPPPCELRSQR